MFQLSSQPIDCAEVRRAATSPGAGAVVSFEGTVRNHHRGKSVLRLEYEAYASVAEKEGGRIVSEAVERFGLDHAVAVHRVGTLEVEDVAVIVVVSSPHRAEAFDACRFIIDEIKHGVPIWKKEHFPDGSSEWVGCEGCATAPRHSH